jgi:ketosteroid isomerase-like protein
VHKDEQGRGPDGGVPEILATNRKVVEAFNRGGLEEAREYFHPDVELYDPDLPPGLELRGRDALLKSIGEMVDAFDTMRVRSIEMYPVGDRIVSLVRTEARGEGTRGEMQVEMHDAHVTTFRDGKVVYWRIYHDPREAFADVGLDPDAPGEPYRIDSV